MMVYRCDNGKYYGGPQKSCIFCRHCTDIIYDYTNGPYMFCCELGLEPNCECNDFKVDPDDPNIKEVSYG